MLVRGMRIPWGGASVDHQFNSLNCSGASSLVAGGAVSWFTDGRVERLEVRRFRGCRLLTA